MRNNNENLTTASVRSMVERYSFGHKVVSVALSAVLVGFGWPAVSPSEVFAQNDAALSTAAQQSAANDAASAGAADQAVTTAGQATVSASASASAGGDAGAGVGSSSSSSAAASGSQDVNAGAGSAVDEADVADEADVELVLGHGSITYRDQIIAQPADKVTVPVAEKFEFTVEADNGYKLTEVKLKVKGSDEVSIDPDKDGVYTVAAADVAAGAVITLVTAQRQVDADTPQDATPIKDAPATPKADEPAADSTGENGASPSATVGDDGALADDAANTGAVTDDQRTDGKADGEAAVDDAAKADPLKSSLIADVATFANEYGNGISLFAASAQAAEKTYAGTFTLDIENADVAYFHYHNNAAETLNATLTPVGSGTLTVSDYTTQSKGGNVLFFVKPHDNYIFTGLGTAGNGDVYIVGSGKYGNIAGYPGIANVMKAAQEAGYIAAFGYARNAAGTVNAPITISAKSPDMTMSASSSKTENVVPGDTLTFTVNIIPQTTGSGKDSVTGVVVNSATVNGNQVRVNNLTKNADGSYSGTVDYTVTEADCARGSVILDVNATSSYSGTITPTNGSGGNGNGTQVSSSATVTKNASCVCRIAPKNAVDYEFVSGTSGKSLPAGLYGYLPSDTNSYYRGQMVSAQIPGMMEFADTSSNGYWTWAGWDADSKRMTDDGITFTGTWKFTSYESYTVRYVDEQGNQIADPKIVAGNKPGATVTESAIDIPNYTLTSRASQSLTIKAGNASANVITFKYKRNAANYTINYVWNGTDIKVRESKVLSGNVGDTVTCAPEVVVDYTPVSWDAKSVKVDANGNASVTFSYYKNVTATANSATVTYDGQEQSVSGYETTAPAGVTFSGVEAGAKGTNAGDYAATFTQQPAQAVDASGKYLIAKYENGNLRINKSDAVKTIVVAGKSATVVYNGQEQSVSGYTVEGLDDSSIVFSGPEQSDVVAKGTNASEDPYRTAMSATQFSFSSENYSNLELVIKQGGLTITKRPLTITGDGWTDAQDYTGQAYETDAVNVEMASENSTSGLVMGQRCSVSYSLSGTNAGDYTGVFGAPTISAGTRNVTANYDIAMVPGTLHINKVSLKDKVTLTTQDAEMVYVGRALEAKPASAVDPDNAGYGFKIEYQKPNGDWTEDPTEITATNVADSLTGENAVKVRVSDPEGNYEGELTGSENVIVKKRPATITGNGWNSDQPYTGQEYKTNDFSVETGYATNGRGVMHGQAVEATYELAGTEIGDYVGKFAGDVKVKSGDEDVTDNYDLSVVPGKLNIVKGEIAKHVALTPADASKVYDGTPLTAGTATAQDDNGKAVTVEYQKADGTWTTNPADITATNVADSLTGDKAINVRVSSDAYEGYVTSQQKLEIAQRPVEFVGESKTVTYNGSEQSATDITVAAADAGEAAGLVDGQSFEGLTYEAKGTAAGEYAGAFAGNLAIKTVDGADVTSNYAVVKTPGALTINPLSGVIVTVKGNSETKTYTGKQQEAAGFTFEASTPLYGADDFALAEGKKALAQATHVSDSASMGLAADSFENKSANFSDVTFVVAEDGGITITPAELAVATDSAEKSYDGAALTANGQLNGLVNGETVAFETTGSQTDAGESANTYEIDWNAQGNTAAAGDYTVAKQDLGTLRVNAKAIDAAGMTVGKLSDVVYSGLSQQLKPEVKDGDKALSEGKDYTLTFSEDTTNVGAVTVTVKGRGNYAGSVERTYNITPASLTVTTPNAAKVYDGTALRASGSITGFVNGESAPFETTGSRTDVGSTPNTYEIKWNAEGATAKAGNYTVSETVGTLTVSEQAITPGDDPSNPDKDYKGVRVSDPTNVPYDGDAHIWEPEVTDAAGSSLEKGRDYTVSYAQGQDFTNVTGDIVVTISGAGNYKGTVKKSYQITALKVSVETQGATKVYNGTPLTNDEGAISGLIERESSLVSVVPKGKQTEVGSSKNTYDINWNGVRSGNYALDSETLGTLTVTAQSIVPGTEDDPNPEYAGVQVDAPSDLVYDGAVHKWAPTVTDKDSRPLAEGVDYEVSYKAGQDFANVTGAIEVVIAGKGNYAGTVTRTYQITPAALTVETPGAEKVYDGTALTKAASADECVKGLVANETVAFKTTGSQTEVGDSDNTYELAWTGSAKQQNYQVKSEKLGKLVVKESADQITVTTTGGEFTYDGQAHGATVSVSEVPAGYTLERAESTASATDVTADSLAATADVLIIRNAAGEDVTSKLNIKRIDGSVKINPATLTVTTPDASKVYDGTALTAAGSVEGYVNGETATFETTGSQTVVGASKNTYKIAWTGTAKAENYIVSETIGTLTVTEQSITPGDDPANPSPSYKGIQVGQLSNTVYNGKEQKFEPRVTDATGATLVKDRDYTLSWSADATNAGTVKVTVAGKGNYAGSVERSYVIAKRPVSLKSESASKVYDGVALERPDVVVTSEYDFVAGEVTAMTATGSITNAGSVVNEIALTTASSFKASNYDVAKDEGLLTVMKAAASDGIALSVKSEGKLYDGAALALPEASASALQGANDVVIEYQKADGSWTANAADVTATNVADSREVLVRASSERNFEGYAYGTASLTVSVRNVTLKSETASKVYDGTALERPDVEVAGDGFVSGEVSDIRATGSVAAVGFAPNAITYQAGESFLAGNYNIALEPGTLTVTAQSIVPGTEDDPNPAYAGVQVDSPSDHVYDGAEHKWAPAVTDKDGKPLAEGVDYEVSYKAGQDFTNVTGNIAVTITGAGNYAGTVTRTYQITPAPVKIETQSASKTYDGTELTAGGSIAGIVAGETVDFAATGSRMAVGSSPNTYRLEWTGTAQQSNYRVVEQKIGMLTVNEYAGKVTVTTTGGEFTYDGQAHGATVSVAGLPAGYSVEQAYSNASARNVADGEVPATADVLVIKNAQGQDVTGQLDIAFVNGTLKVNPAELTVSTGSAEKQYDGTPAANEEAKVSGTQGTDGVFAWATGEQTEVGSSDNTYGISWGTVDSGNYRVVEQLGTLTVNPNTAAVEIQAASDSKVYDGAALETSEVASISGLPEGFTVELAASGSQTDAGTSANEVERFVIKNQYGEDATAFFANVTVKPGTLTVTPAEVRVTTEGAEKVYDGTPLTNANGSIEGLVGSETAKVVPSGSQTEVGSSANGYAIEWGSAKAANYQVVGETLGTLKVTPQSVTPGTDPADPDPAYKGIEVSSPTDIVYDGGEHRWSPEVKDGSKVLAEGIDYTVAYGTNDFTNVTGGIVVTITGTGNYTGTATRTYRITPAPLTVATESATRAYDGTALTAPGRIEGLVAGETVAFEVTGSQVNAGTSVNGYTLAWSGTAKASNYSVAEQLGTLLVTKADIANFVTLATVDATKTYDGTPLAAATATAADSLGNAVAVQYSLDGVNWFDDAADITATNVFDSGTVLVRATSDANYAGAIEGTQELTITPASLEVTTDAATKEFDGTPLTSDVMSIEGLVPGDSVTAKTTGSQTQVGTSKNTYHITWTNADERNYAISEQLGDLTVTPAPVVPPTPDSDNPGTNPGGDNPGTTPGGTSPGDNPDGTVPQTATPAPANPVDAVAQALEAAVDVVTGASADDQAAEEQIFDDENPLGRSAHVDCWVHYFMLLGMLLTVLYGAGVMGRRGRFSHGLASNLNDVLGASGKNN